MSAVYDLCRESGRKAEYHLYHDFGTRAPMTYEHAAGIIPLISAQPYIASSEFTPRPCGVTLNAALRKFHHSKGQISDHYHHWLDIPFGNRSNPWLTVPRKNSVAPVIVARSARYHGRSFPWGKIVEAVRGQAVFVGTAREHADFTHNFGPIPYQPTNDLLELACVIAGADLFIGNQSCPRAIAEGLKLPVIVEEGNPPDTHFLRPDAWYGTSSEFWPPVLDEVLLKRPGVSVASQATLLGHEDPLPAPFRSEPSDWARRPSVIEQHSSALRSLPDREIGYPGGAGRGIVTCGDQSNWPRVIVMLRLLRESGCELPVECWFHGGIDTINSSRVMELGVTLLSLEAAGRTFQDRRAPFSNKLPGGEHKWYALARSRFETCLWLDPELHVATDPTGLFALSERQRISVWASPAGEQGSLPETVRPAGRPCPPGFGSQACLIHRPSAWKEIVLAHWICQHSDYYFEHLSEEEDPLRLALAVTGRAFKVLACLTNTPVGERMRCYALEGRTWFFHRPDPQMRYVGIPRAYEAAAFFADTLRPRDEARELQSLAGQADFSPDRLRLIRDSIIGTNHLPGDLIEVGPVIGGASRFIGCCSPHSMLHLCDTSGILPEPGALDRKRQPEKNMAEMKMAGCRHANAQALFHLGAIPSLSGPARFRFARIDTERLQPALEALNYLATRIVKEGILMLDHSRRPKCPALDRMLRDQFAQEQNCLQTPSETIIRF
ncbi:alpha-mannosyltransferase [Zavarzinella formosa]|uniref:hypothetical protein n=1 Tax=Zavarzinella formosa TaxID=360055 RepID=UPI0012F91AC9|nr:hypothetical protein [Zavarzinella formosa]